MSIVELSLAVIALSAAATGIAVWVLVRRVLPLLADHRSLIEKANRGMDRAHHVLGHVETTVGEIRGIEHRVARTLHLALDQVEPGLHGTLALVAGVNGVLRALLGGGTRRRRSEDTSTNQPPQKKGVGHE